MTLRAQGTVRFFQGFDFSPSQNVGISFFSVFLGELKGSLKIRALRDLETTRKVFSSLGLVKQDKSFLFLTQLAGFPGVCLETLSAKASLPQEHFSCGGKNGQAITGSPCHHVEGTSGSPEPYGTLHFCSFTCKIVHASLCMSDSRNRASQQGSDSSFLLLPLCFGLDHLQHLGFCRGA